MGVAHLPPRAEATVEKELLSLLPLLRGYARLLTKDASDADDLVQEALARAISHLDQFTPGTNLRAWLFTILRNTHFTEVKRRSKEAGMRSQSDVDAAGASAGQSWSLAAIRVRQALEELPREQRDLLILVCGVGVSYEEAASMTDAAVGTVKSRISRGRRRLAELLDVDTVEDLAPGDCAVRVPPVWRPPME